MSCDIVDTHMVDNSSNDQTKVVQANQQLGMIGSSLEHLVLEQLFATDTGAEGFSAVKAIQLANQQGQKIFTVTKDNYQTIIPQLQLAPAAIADIQAAAQNGLTVTTHQNRISVNGYTGEGYIILNDRGTGAWMINGGLYGGIITLAQAQYIFFGMSIWGTSQQWFANALVKALQADLQRFVKAFGNIAAFASLASLASFVLDIIDVYERCNAAPSLVLLTKMGFLVAASILFVVYSGPLGILAGSLWLGILSSNIKADYLKEHNCEL